jgi:anti-sigma factor RsiW
MTTTRRGCDFPAERLIAYRDGDLDGAQREVVQTHLAACPDCRAWLGAMAEVRRILRAAFPLIDDPAARATIKARIATLSPPKPARESVMSRGRVT